MGEEECFSAGPRTAWGCCKAGCPRGHSPDVTQLRSAHHCSPRQPQPPPPVSTSPAGNKWHVPNLADGTSCDRAGKHPLASLHKEKATRVKKTTEKDQNKAIRDTSTHKFPKVFLAPSFELKETAV